MSDYAKAEVWRMLRTWQKEALDSRDEIKRLRAALEETVAQMEYANNYSNGRWCEWGERAEEVRDRYEDAEEIARAALHPEMP